MAEDKYGFELIENNYERILIGSSALSRNRLMDRNIPGQEIPLSRKEAEVGRALEFIDYLKWRLDKGAPIYTTEGVFKENQGGEAEVKKVFGRRRRKYRANSLAVQTMQRITSARESLVAKIKQRGQILNFSGNDFEDYQRFCQEYEQLKGFHGLSDVDFDLLISSYVLVQNHGSCAMLNNDMGIVEAWKRIGQNRIDFSDWGMFLRIRFERFERYNKSDKRGENIGKRKSSLLI